MQLHPLTPHVWVTDPQPETDRPTLGYIRGATAALAIDAGNSPAHLQAFYRLLEEASLPLPQLTVLTHWHWDHTFALCALPGPSLCGSATQQKLLQVSRWQWDEASVARRLASGEEIPFCDTHQRAEYGSLSAIQVRPATFAFSGSLVLDLGGVHCRLWETDSPPHPGQRPGAGAGGWRPLFGGRRLRRFLRKPGPLRPGPPGGLYPAAAGAGIFPGCPRARPASLPFGGVFLPAGNWPKRAASRAVLSAANRPVKPFSPQNAQKHPCRDRRHLCRTRFFAKKPRRRWRLRQFGGII